MDDSGITIDDSIVYEGLQCSTCKKLIWPRNTKDNWSQTKKTQSFQNNNPGIGVSKDETISFTFDEFQHVCCASKNQTTACTDNKLSTSMNVESNFSKEEIEPIVVIRPTLKSHETISYYGIQNNDEISYDFGDKFEGNILHESLIHSTNASINGVFKKDFDIDKNNSKEELLEIPSKNRFENAFDNWYASASDEEEDQGLLSNSHSKNVALNPVLECVNQILLQQSMVEPNNECEFNSVDCRSKLAEKNLSNIENNFRKRYHTSNGNNYTSEPRIDSDQNHNNIFIPNIICSRNKHTLADQIKDNSLNYESIYSNEYEPIGSENASSHVYVDMEAKDMNEDSSTTGSINSKQPPALPPKPANLIKLKKKFQENESIKSNDDDNPFLSESGYCCIPERTPSATSVQVIVDVHKDEHNLDSERKHLISSSQGKENTVIEEIFASIPNISNLSALTVPKPEKSKTNSTIKSHKFQSAYKSQKSPRQSERKNVSNILAEINKRITETFPISPPKSQKNIKKEIANVAYPVKNDQVSVINSIPSEKDKSLLLEAEFDWYNLDVEYGKTSAKHVYYSKSSEELNTVDRIIQPLGVEYNLDEEFSLAGNREKSEENKHEPSSTIIDIDLPYTACEKFAPPKKVNSCLNLKNTSYQTFIDSSGLSIKSLPRRKKIYFAGPFV